MNTKDIKIIEPGFYYYQKEDFATIKLGFRFNFKPSKKNCLIADLLCDYMNRCNGKYHTLKEINDKCRDLYAADYAVRSKRTGQKHYIDFNYTMLDHKIIGDNFFKDAIDFFKEIMFNPLFKDNKLDSKTLAKIKQDMYDDEKEANLEPAEMQYRYFLKSIIPKSNIVKTNFLNLTELVKVLNEITDEDIINFYYELLKNYSRGWCFGNLSDEEINYISNTFKFKTSNLQKDYFHLDEIKEGYKEIKDKETTQSYLYMTYAIKDYKPEEVVLYDAILSMLNSSMTGLVLKVLRQELELVYSASADFFTMRGIIYITAKIDKKNKEKCIEGINEIFRRLHDKKIITKLLKYHKEKCNEIYISNKDNISYYLGNFTSYVYENEMEEDEEIKIINSLKVSDILNAVNRMELKNTFFYRGDK